jgi:hypothetical protein
MAPDSSLSLLKRKKILKKREILLKKEKMKLIDLSIKISKIYLQKY